MKTLEEKEIELIEEFEVYEDWMDRYQYLVDLECDWQIVLSCGDYQICYQGLQTCNLREGAIIEGGQTMGTAEEYLKVKMVKQTG